MTSVLSFDDDQLDLLMAACAPLDPQRRGAFMEIVAAELAGVRELGPGDVSRAISAARQRLSAPPPRPARFVSCRKCSG